MSAARLLILKRVPDDEMAKLRAKDELLQDFAIKSERVHTMTQLAEGIHTFRD